MLNVMREIKGHWLLKAVLVVVALSMTLYLGAYFTDRGAAGGSGDWAAMVDGSPIDARDYIQATRNMDSYYRSILGDQYESLKPNLQLGQQSLQRLVDKKIMLLEADRLGLQASPEEVSDAILGAPEFKDASGNFIGKDAYLNLVQRVGGAEAFEGSLADDIVIQKWQEVVTESADVSTMELEHAFRTRTVKSAIDYVLLAASDQSMPTSVSDDEVAAWYESHGDDYLRDESRRVRYVVVARQDMADRIELTAEDLQAFYDDNATRYEHPAQRRASHILFRIEPGSDDAQREMLRTLAENTLARLQGGEDFASTARAVSQDPVSASRGGDLGYFGRGEMVPEFETAVWDTPVGDFAGVTETDFGFHVIQVTADRDAGTTPLDEVEEEIRRELTSRRSQALLQDEARRIRDAITTPDQFTTVAGQEGLEIVEVTVSATDRMADLGPSPELRSAIQESAAGTILEPLTVARGTAIVAVDEIVPPEVAPLEEVRDQVRTAILNDRARAAARAAADRAMANGRDFDAAVRASGQEAKDSGELAPGRIVLPGSGGDSPELRAALFSPTTAVGDTGVVDVPAGAVMYRVSRHIPFDPETYAASEPTLRRELLNQKRGALLEDIMANLREQYDVRVNQELVDRFNS